MINDEQDLIVNIRDYLQANLNGKITAINTEKADFVCDLITNSSDYFVLAGEMVDFPNNAFVQIAISPNGIILTNNFNEIKSEVEMIIEVAFDDPSKPKTYLKSLRYMRALYQTMIEYESTTKEVGGLKITAAAPMFISTNHRKLVASGVTVNAVIG